MSIHSVKTFTYKLPYEHPQETVIVFRIYNVIRVVVFSLSIGMPFSTETIIAINTIFTMNLGFVTKWIYRFLHMETNQLISSDSFYLDR